MVRAPETIAELPTVVNNTKALAVWVEPNTSNLPSFKIKVLNVSVKPVMAYAFETSTGGQRHLSGINRNLNNTVLIEPGQTIERVIRYPLKPVAASTGETPRAESDLVLTIPSTMFSDGTYEGDPFWSARFRAIQIGQKIQFHHLQNQLDSKYDSIDAFAAAISDYKFYMDEAVFRDFISEFPGLTERQVADLRECVEAAAIETQKAFFTVFSAKRVEFTTNPAGLQAWTKAESGQCQKLLDALP